MEVTTMLTFHVFHLTFSFVYCADNTKKPDTGPSVVNTTQADILAIHEAANKNPIDFKAMFDIIACCRTLDERKEIDSAYAHSYGSGLQKSLFNDSTKDDLGLKMYFEYMLYDSHQVQAAVIKDSAGNSPIYVGVISTSGCDDLKKIRKSFRALSGGMPMLEYMRHWVKFGSSREKSYFLFNANPWRNCRPANESLDGPEDAYKHDLELMPSTAIVCAANETRISMMQIHSFAYYKLLITKFMKQNVIDIVGRCTGQSTIEQSIRKILLYSVNPAEYYAAEIHDNCQDSKQPVFCAQTLRYILLMRNEIDIEEINTLYSKNYKGAKISDLINNLDKNKYSDNYKYALQQSLNGNRKHKNQ